MGSALEGVGQSIDAGGLQVVVDEETGVATGFS